MFLSWNASVIPDRIWILGVKSNEAIGPTANAPTASGVTENKESEKV